MGHGGTMERIDKVAVLGAGVMGGTIAAHLANAGLDVLLLDVATPALDALKAAKPAALFLPAVASRIRVGTFGEDAARLRDRDWVIEVVVENLEVKRKLLVETVAPNLRPGAILSSNTSGLSVNALADALPEPLRARFLVTHFFNPPRYMRLLEIVPSRHTDPAVVARMADFLSRRAGKGIVFAKDTPNFVANRIGVYAICNAMKHM